MSNPPLCLQYDLERRDGVPRLLLTGSGAAVRGYQGPRICLGLEPRDRPLELRKVSVQLVVLLLDERVDERPLACLFKNTPVVVPQSAVRLGSLRCLGQDSEEHLFRGEGHPLRDDEAP